MLPKGAAQSAIAPPAREMRSRSGSYRASPFMKPSNEVTVMIVQEDFDNQTSAQSKFEEYIDQLTAEIPPEIEIDSVPDDLGELYRVWYGFLFLGTFYQNFEGKWIARSGKSDEKLCCDTSDAAQAFIMATNGLLTADAA
jgi:hypothetical protein